MDTGDTLYLLAESDIWSELFSFLIIFLVVSLPAILRTLAEKGKKLRQQSPEPEKLRDIAAMKPKPGRQAPVSEWDRRQELIRQRLVQLQEKQSPGRPQTSTKPLKLKAAKDVIMPEVPARIPAIQQPKPTARLTNELPTPERIPKTISYVSMPAAPKTAMPAVSSKVKPIQREQKTTSATSRLEAIIRTKSPLKASIILKEVLDRPRALRFGLDEY